MTIWNKLKAFLKKDEAMSDERDHHIDALKGVAIILVVLGHSIQINDPQYDHNLLFRIVFSIQMPLFMFLSGFIVLTQLHYSYLDFIRKNSIRLLIPFLVWHLIGYGLIPSNQEASLATHFLNLIKAPGIGLWFLWVLFLNGALLFGALKFARYKNWQRQENYFVIAAIFLSLAASPDFLALSEFKQYFPYYAAGFFACKYLDVLRAYRKIIYTTAVISFPFLVLGWMRNAMPTFYPTLANLITNEPIARLIVSIYKYAVSFSGFAFCSFFLGRMNGMRFYWFLCWLGTLTLDIYVCHGYFLIRFGNGAVQYFSAALVCMVLALSLTLLIMKRFKITRLLLLGQRR
jgi:fucose 4-O-acetylase-like acetyltransferase